MIQHPTRGKIPFLLYPFQEDTLKQLQHNRFNIILKARQMGISTLTAGFALHSMLFNSDFKILIIATRQDVARNLLQKVQIMHDNLPVFLRQQCIENNKLSLKFANGSEIKAVSSAANSGRSEALSLLIIDEAAFVDRIDDIWVASQATLSTGGAACLLSTPNGQGNLFHRLWVQAEEGKAPDGLEKFNPIRLKWNLHPERDEKWRRQWDESLGKREAAQEFDCDFITSGHTVIDSDIITWYVGNSVKDPIEKRGPGGDLWIWEYPDYTKSYVVSADVARGDGADYSAFHVFEVETAIQVAEFKSKVDTRMFGNLLVAIANEYNSALLVIDNRNVGWDTVQVALDKGYKNLYYSYRHDPFLDDAIHLHKAYDMVSKSDMIPGFTTTPKIRPVMISKMQSYLADLTPTIRSKRTINELYVFVWKNGKQEADTGYNDDLVISLSMFYFVRDTALRLRSMGIQLTRATLSKTHKSVFKASAKTNNHWSMPVGNTRESLTWLL